MDLLSLLEYCKARTIFRGLCVKAQLELSQFSKVMSMIFFLSKYLGVNKAMNDY